MQYSLWAVDSFWGRSMKIAYYKDERGEWRWRLRAENNEIIAASSEGYKHFTDARKNIQDINNFFDKVVIQGMVIDVEGLDSE